MLHHEYFDNSGGKPSFAASSTNGS